MPRPLELFTTHRENLLPGTSSFQERLFSAEKKVKYGDAPHKKKYLNRYFLKKVDDSTHEVAIMEFYRLLIPQQPKYRSVQDLYQLSHYVQSQAIQGKTVFEMDKDSFQDICSHTNYGTSLGVKGLGAIECLNEFILYNADKHLGNLILDEQLQLYKIDGEDVYWQQLKIKELTKLKDHFNTLHGIHEIYTHEFNQVLLRFLVLPQILLEVFCQKYHVKADDKNALLGNQIFLKHLARTKDHHDALYFPQFINYVLNPKSLEDIQHFITHLECFVISGKKKLLSDSINIKSLILENLSHFKAIIENHLTLSEFQVFIQQNRKVFFELSEKCETFFSHHDDAWDYSHSVEKFKKNMGDHLKKYSLHQPQLRSITLFRPIEEQLSGLILLLMSFGFILLLYGGISDYAYQFFLKIKYIENDASSKLYKKISKFGS